MNARRNPYSLVALAAALWALISIWATELLDAGLTSQEIGFWRAAIGGSCFIAHAAAQRISIERADLPAQVVFGLVGIGVFYVSLPEAIDAGGVSLAFVLLYTAPAFVLAAEAVRRRHVNPAMVAVLVVALLGVGLVAGASTAERSSAALIWGLLSGATYAIHYLFSRSRHRGQEVVRYAVAMTAGAAVLAPFVRWNDHPGETSLRSWALLAAIGVISTYAPFLALSTALRRADPARAALVATVEPVMATAIGVSIYAEALTIDRTIGAVLVVAAALSATRISVQAERGGQPGEA